MSPAPRAAEAGSGDVEAEGQRRETSFRWWWPRYSYINGFSIFYIQKFIRGCAITVPRVQVYLLHCGCHHGLDETGRRDRGNQEAVL